MITELDLQRAHEGLCAAASACRRREAENPRRAFLESAANDFLLPGGEDDPTPVPPGLSEALTACAERRGYRVHWVSGGEVSRRAGKRGVLGLTEKIGYYGGAVDRDIYLRGDLSPASTVRLQCHELAHAMIDGALPQHFADFEECLAESVAGIVTGTLGVTNGIMSVRYLAQRDGRLVEAAGEHAAGLAGVILKEVR